jgi:hypothetical protein
MTNKLLHEHEQQALTVIIARTTRSVSQLSPEAISNAPNSQSLHYQHITTQHVQGSSFHPFYSGKAHKDLTPFLSTIIMARPSLTTTSGNHNKPLNPTSRMTLERARLLLDQMDQQLLEIHERSIAIRKAILIIKTKLLADARKRRDSETF